MKSFIDVLYIDPNGSACKTGLGLALETNTETRHQFSSFQKYQVPAERAVFLLEYYNSNNSLRQTIYLDEKGFVTVIGNIHRADAYYHQLDTDSWNREAYDLAHKKGDLNNAP